MALSKHVIRDARGKATPIEGAAALYNAFYNNWISFVEQNPNMNVFLMRYEDILRNQTSFVRGLQSRFLKLTQAQKEQASQPIFTLNGVDQSEGFSKKRVVDYLDQKNFAILDDTLLSFAKTLFDSDLVTNKLGYPIP